MKKILAVATALVLAISSLCVFVVADSTTTTYTYDSTGADGFSLSSYWGSSASANAITFTSQWGEMYVNLPSSVDLSTVTSITCTFSGVSGTVQPKIYYADGTEGYPGSVSADGSVTATLSGELSKITIQDIVGSSSATLESVTVTAETTTTSTTEVEVTETLVYDSTGTSGYTLSSYWGSTASDDTITFTSQWGEMYVILPSSIDVSKVTAITCTFTGVSGTVQPKIYYADGSEGYPGSVSADGSVAVTLSGELSKFTIQGTVDSSAATLASVTVTYTKTVASSTSSSRNQGVIYINEDYHGIFVTRTIGTSTRKYLVNVPHTVDANGYCTVCKMYVGGEEAGTATVDGVEYEVAYTSDINLASGSWSDKDLGDTAILEALSTEGALLVVTRDSEQNIVFSNEESIYEKFVLVNSWYSGDTVQLGTAGHTSADEPDTGIIDCISDDGTTAIYDGNTIYDAWVANGLNAGGTTLFISNTSSTGYKIANVAVYVPAGTVVTETVDVDEPAEDTNSETEDDELDVDDTDAEEVTETNPTTGAVLALVPMAIAGFAVVASKRK